MHNVDQYFTPGGSSQKQATAEVTERKGEHKIEINSACGLHRCAQFWCHYLFTAICLCY
jgi:hypothetical protein